MKIHRRDGQYTRRYREMLGRSIMKAQMACYQCERLSVIETFQAGEQQYTTIVDNGLETSFYVSCEETDFQLKFICSDCRGLFMGFRETKVNYEAAIQKAKERPVKFQATALMEVQAQMAFELYAEMSSLNVQIKRIADAYEKMAKLAEDRQKK